MSNATLLTVLAGVLVALPGTAALVPNLDLTPLRQFILLVLALIGAAILRQQRPSGERVTEDGELSDQEVERIAQARERIRRAEIARIRAAGDQRG